jgi:hypothetical protein
MRHLRKWLILSHRYLGIALGAVFTMWFASGLVMIYAGGMPQLDPDVRRESLAPLDAAAIRLSPAEAAERASLRRWPSRRASWTAPPTTSRSWIRCARPTSGR